MFHKNMKIVVIGSNTKRKAGPRVGSEGYILNINKLHRTPQLVGVLVGSADVIFTRFGFEKKARIEKLNVLLVCPDINIGDNPRKAVNKAVRIIKKSTLNNVIIAVPAIEDAISYHEICAKILCKIESIPYINVMQYVLNNTLNTWDLLADKNKYGDITRLLSIMPKHVLTFADSYQKCRKFSDKIDLISKYYYLEPTHMAQLFNIVNICEILEEKYNDKYKPKHNYNRYYIDTTTIITNLFSIYKFNEQAKNHKEISTLLKALTTEMQNKGSIIINKHL